MALRSDELKKVTRLSYSAGFIGIIWFITCNPQQIWSILLQKYLGASSTQLGIVIGLTQLASIFHLSSVYFFSKVKSRKRYWFSTTLIQRSMAFVIALAAFYAYGGGDKYLAFLIISIASVFNMMIANTGSAGWFAWMDELIPSGTRASFFGKRSAISQLSNVIFFFLITFLLDSFSSKIFLVYGFVYLGAGVAGCMDIILHYFIPETEGGRAQRTFTLGKLIAPLKNKSFLKFCLVMGFNLFSLNIIGPFVAPWIVSLEHGLGASNLWVGITVVISQMAWVLSASFWGKIMDKVGKKTVVMVGSLFPVSWLILLFANSSNFSYILPIAYLFVGLLSSAFFDGMLQLTFSLSDEENRATYVAWYWTFFGVFGAIGPIIGGKILDFSNASEFTNTFMDSGIHVNILFAAGLSFIGLIFYSFVHVDEKPVRQAVKIIFNPGIFRTLSSMAIIENEKVIPSAVEGSLRKISGKTAELAVPEIIGRLQDPKRSIREEAVKTLGRIGGDPAVKALIEELEDPCSLIREEAARALSLTGDRKALPYLISGLDDDSEDVQEACADALADMDECDSIEYLLKLLKHSRSEKVRVSGALALSRKGRREAGEDIFCLMQHSQNKVFKKQLSIALADMLGNPGGFYPFVQGFPRKAEESFLQLVQDVEVFIKSILRKNNIELKNYLIKELLPKMKQDYHNCKLDLVMAAEKKLFLDIVYSILGNLDEAPKKDFLQMRFWFFNHFEESEVFELDILIGLYSLKSLGKKQLN